jgi:hypothetical protein
MWEEPPVRPWFEMPMERPWNRLTVEDLMAPHRRLSGMNYSGGFKRVTVKMHPFLTVEATTVERVVEGPPDVPR